MTDAVREYKEWVRENYAKHAAEMWNPMDAGYANGIDATETKADAAIAELEAKLHTLGHGYDALRNLLEAVELEEITQLEERAEKAEAEVQRLRVAEAEAMNILEGTELKLEQAEADLAAMTKERDEALRLAAEYAPHLVVPKRRTS